jgi:hypothetical protein
MTIVEILRAGKARLLECGWCQGDEKAIFGPPDGPCCAATAMSRSLPKRRAPTWSIWDAPPFEEAVDTFKLVNGISGPIGQWNDAPERTLDDVIAAYDKAIAAAEDNEKRG